MLPNEEEESGEEIYPLDYLSEKEASLAEAAIIIFDEAIEDEELKDQIIGVIFLAIEEWGIEQEKKKGMH